MLGLKLNHVSKRGLDEFYFHVKDGVHQQFVFVKYILYIHIVSPSYNALLLIAN